MAIRTRRWLVPAICLGFALVMAGCSKSTDGAGSTSSASAAPSARVAVSNSYLEAAAQDLLGKSSSLLRLAEPGMCPGHFDVRPRQVEELRRCRVLLRFDFQASMDDQLRHLLNHGLEVRGIQVGGGLCEPASYLGACRQVAEALVAVGLLDRGAADATLPQIEARVQAAGATCRQQVAQAGWKGRQVLCSAHQEAFCKWLGLEVPATFSGSDASSIGDIEGAIQQGARHRVQLIIANLPEGRRLADALGSRLGVPIIVFGNFPLMRPEQASFDDLLATNVGELIQAAKQ